MKKYLALVIIASFIGTSALYAQRKGQTDEDMLKKRRERVERHYKSRKIAYITERLDLTPDEAEDFWPLYNEFDKKRLEIQKQTRETEKQNYIANYYQLDGDTEELDDKEALEQIDKFLTLKREEADLWSNYTKKFLKILPPAKVYRLYTMEGSFKKTMLRNMRTVKRSIPTK